MEHILHTHPKSQILNNIPKDRVIIDEEFKHLFKCYKPVPNKPGHIIVYLNEYKSIIFRKLYGYSK